MENKNPQTQQPLRRRKRIRLKKYDYTQPGMYFITIVCQDWRPRFGKIEPLPFGSNPRSPVKANMILNDAGKMLQEQWLKLPDRFPHIQLHAYVIMPDHFHAILEITSSHTPEKKPTLGAMLGGFQSIVTNEYIRGVHTKGWPPFHDRLWHRNYYEHIIRTPDAFMRITEYINENPEKWLAKSTSLRRQ